MKMTRVSYERLVNIISYIPKTNTCCEDTMNFISDVLSNNWDHKQMKDLDIKWDDDYDKNYYSPHWISNKYCEEYLCLNSINEIDNYLIKYGYLSIHIYLKFDRFPIWYDHQVDHTFVVCQTDKGQVICDSYVHTRPTEIRPFDLHESLASLIKNPTIKNWNRIWGSTHSDKIDESCFPLSIKVLYYDVNRNTENYVNGVRLC